MRAVAQPRIKRQEKENPEQRSFRPVLLACWNGSRLPDDTPLSGWPTFCRAAPVSALVRATAFHGMWRMNPAGSTFDPGHAHIGEGHRNWISSVPCGPIVAFLLEMLLKGRAYGITSRCN